MNSLHIQLIQLSKPSIAGPIQQQNQQPNTGFTGGESKVDHVEPGKQSIRLLACQSPTSSANNHEPENWPESAQRAGQLGIHGVEDFDRFRHKQHNDVE